MIKNPNAGMEDSGSIIQEDPQPLLQCLLSSTVRCSISFLIRVLAAVAAIILRTAPEIAVAPGTASYCQALRTCSKPKISLEISFHLASEFNDVSSVV